MIYKASETELETWKPKLLHSTCQNLLKWTWMMLSPANKMCISISELSASFVEQAQTLNLYWVKTGSRSYKFTSLHLLNFGTVFIWFFINELQQNIKLYVLSIECALLTLDKLLWKCKNYNVVRSTWPVTVYSLLYQPLDAIPIAVNKCLRLSPGFCSEYSM